MTVQLALTAAGSILLTLIITSLYRLVTVSARKRLSLPGAVDEIIPTVNQMSDAIPVIMDMLIAIGEAIHDGKSNGNVTKALEEIRAERTTYEVFVHERSKIKVAI